MTTFLNKLLLILMGMGFLSIAQADPIDLNQSQIAPETKNIQVRKLSSDKNASHFLIFIKKGVKRHKHIYPLYLKILDFSKDRSCQIRGLEF